MLILSLLYHWTQYGPNFRKKKLSEKREEHFFHA